MNPRRGGGPLEVERVESRRGDRDLPGGDFGKIPIVMHMNLHGPRDRRGVADHPLKRQGDPGPCRQDFGPAEQFQRKISTGALQDDLDGKGIGT